MSPLCVKYEIFLLALAMFLPSWTAGRVTNSEDRQGRWLWGSREIITKTVKYVNTVAMLTASSCYVMETNLPKCELLRRRRDIRIDATPTIPILSTTAPVLEDLGNYNALGAASLHRQSREYADGFVLDSAALDPSNDQHDIQYPVYGATPVSDEVSRYGRQAVAAPESSVAKENVTSEDLNQIFGNSTLKAEPLSTGWLEYFHLRDLTSTVSVKVDSTKWYVDPSHMVTFSVRGCEPRTMPFDMAKCHDAYLGPKKNAPIIDAGTPSADAAEDTKTATNTTVSQELGPLSQT